MIVGGAIGALVMTQTGSTESLQLGHEVLGILAGAFGALTPDIDMPGTMLGRWIPWPSIQEAPGYKGFQRKGRRGLFGPIWHRGQLHSLGFAVVVTALMSALYLFVSSHIDISGVLQPSLLELFAICIAAGALSHLAVDCINMSPMMMFWPLSHKLVTAPVPHAPQASMRGRFYELIVVAGIVVIVFLLGGASIQAFENPTPVTTSAATAAPTPTPTAAPTPAS